MGLDRADLRWFYWFMAGALRSERPGGRYHVTARGNEGKDLFRDDTDHFHSLELLGGWDYAVVSKAMTRFGRRLVWDAGLAEHVVAIPNQLSK